MKTANELAEGMAKAASREWFGPNPPTENAYANLEHDILHAIPLVELIELARAAERQNKQVQDWNKAVISIIGRKPLTKIEDIESVLTILRTKIPEL